MWLYQAHLGFLFGGRIFAIVQHGRRSGKRYVTGLEALPPMLPGCDFGDASRRRLAESGTIIAFRPT